MTVSVLHQRVLGPVMCHGLNSVNHEMVPSSIYVWFIVAVLESKLWMCLVGSLNSLIIFYWKI